MTAVNPLTIRRSLTAILRRKDTSDMLDHVSLLPILKSAAARWLPLIFYNMPNLSCAFIMPKSNTLPTIIGSKCNLKKKKKKHMTSDILTKALGPTSFLHLRPKLLGM